MFEKKIDQNQIIHWDGDGQKTGVGIFSGCVYTISSNPYQSGGCWDLYIGDNPNLDYKPDYQETNLQSAKFLAEGLEAYQRIFSSKKYTASSEMLLAARLAGLKARNELATQYLLDDELLLDDSEKDLEEYAASCGFEGKKIYKLEREIRRLGLGQRL